MPATRELNATRVSVVLFQEICKSAQTPQFDHIVLFQNCEIVPVKILSRAVSHRCWPKGDTIEPERMKVLSDDPTADTCCRMWIVDVLVAVAGFIPAQGCLTSRHTGLIHSKGICFLAKNVLSGLRRRTSHAGQHRCRAEVHLRAKLTTCFIVCCARIDGITCM